MAETGKTQEELKESIASFEKEAPEKTPDNTLNPNLDDNNELKIEKDIEKKDEKTKQQVDETKIEVESAKQPENKNKDKTEEKEEKKEKIGVANNAARLEDSSSEDKVKELAKLIGLLIQAIKEEFNYTSVKSDIKAKINLAIDAVMKETPDLSKEDLSKKLIAEINTQIENKEIKVTPDQKARMNKDLSNLVSTIIDNFMKKNEQKQNEPNEQEQKEKKEEPKETNENKEKLDPKKELEKEIQQQIEDKPNPLIKQREKIDAKFEDALKKTKEDLYQQVEADHSLNENQKNELKQEVDLSFEQYATRQLQVSQNSQQKVSPPTPVNMKPTPENSSKKDKKEAKFVESFKEKLQEKLEGNVAVNGVTITPQKSNPDLLEIVLNNNNDKEQTFTLNTKGLLSIKNQGNLMQEVEKLLDQPIDQRVSALQSQESGMTDASHTGDWNPLVKDNENKGNEEKIEDTSKQNEDNIEEKDNENEKVDFKKLVTESVIKAVTATKKDQEAILEQQEGKKTAPILKRT